MTDVIILDGHLKSALAAVRSLGSCGISVAVGSDRGSGMALHSRYAKKTFLYPRPIDDLSGFLAAVKAQGNSTKPLVYTFSDATSAALSRARNELEEHVSFTLPSSDNFETAFDKGKTAALAEKLCIPVPSAVSNEQISQWPVVVKPRVNYHWHGNNGHCNHVTFAFSPAELQRLFDTFSRTTGGAPIVQEYMHGREMGVELLMWHGRALAWSAHERLRSLDPAGGASVYKKTIPLDRGLGDAAERIMMHLGWHGPVMVEFKQPRNGPAYLIEINGRFWGSLPLSIRAGADFPLWLYQLHKNDAIKECPAYQVGIASQYFLGNVMWLLRVLFRSSLMRRIAYPKRVQAIVDFLRSIVTPDDVWSISDPAPFFWDCIDKLKS